MNEPVELLDSLANQGVVLWGEGSRLRFRASNGSLTEAMRSQLAVAQRFGASRLA